MTGHLGVDSGVMIKIEWSLSNLTLPTASAHECVQSRSTSGEQLPMSH